MASGIEVRGKRIRVYFTYRGEKCRESLDLEPTDENKAYAQRMVEQIAYEIRNGLFDYGRYFPNSKRLRGSSVNYYLDLLLEIKKEQIASSTYRGYEGMARRYIKPKFGHRQVESLDYVEIESWRSQELAHLSSKTIKDTLHVLQMMFGLYRKRFPQATDPTEGIVVNLPDRDDPDPFTREEITKILAADCNDRFQELNLIKFNIWTGPRILEAIALAWEDVIDLEKGKIYFRRARVHGIYKATKTKRAKRIIELLSPAKEALREQWQLTSNLPVESVQVVQRDNRTIKDEQLRFVFFNTNTQKPHYSEYTVRERFFRAHLKRAKVRYRGTNQCRHTCISQMLTANMPTQWISKQTGTSEEMIRRHYGKWINEDAPEMVSLAESRLKL